jgi:hypothetical protein
MSTLSAAEKAAHASLKEITLMNPRLRLFAAAGLLVLIAGCTTFKPYAQNPFNPNARIKADSPASGSGQASDSTAFRAAGLGLAAASRPIPGALPHGAGVGIAAAALLLGGTSRPPVAADNANYLVVAMPLADAQDEADAQVKMGVLVEQTIVHALSPAYRAKIVEYDDHYAFGRVLRPRWLRVDGPQCENWSCQVTAPMPTEQAAQWEGEMATATHKGQASYQYKHAVNEKIGFVKIVKEYDQDGLIAGLRHFVEGRELPGFDYPAFYQRVSAQLSDWVYLRVALAGRGLAPYTLSRGTKIE